ncbi:hypothetical protein DYB32_010312 [Aphanomyces invadans]|uniref:Uncharacterized protein n=1 Tax=Aphanomyces invadans TaxID=157072 RepID=A0A418AG68_9STRA|nr:hypothetical protein DYB32_010312 [Aphanomyces invadans]
MLDSETPQDTMILSTLITPLCFVHISILHVYRMCFHDDGTSMAHRNRIGPFHSASSKVLPLPIISREVIVTGPPRMSKNKALDVKDFKKTERAAVASGKDIQLNKNVLKRKKSSEVQKVDFNSIHYLDQSDCENLNAIRRSLIEKVQAAKRVNERFRRDLDRAGATVDELSAF